MRSHWYGVTASLVGLTLTAALLLTLAGPSEARPTAPTPTPGPVAGYMDHLPLITNGAFLGKSNLPAQGDLRDYTSYQVMNLAKSPGAIAHIRVDYYTSNGVLVYSAILPDLAPLTAQTVAQKTEAGLPEGVYSAVLTSDQPITALVTEALGDPAVPGPTMSAPLSMYEGVTLGSSRKTSAPRSLVARNS